MSLAPQRKVKKMLQYFEDDGPSTLTYPLLHAVFHERVEKAEQVIAADPNQLNSQDPFAGLTPLHIAIFRENRYLVNLIEKHPTTDFKLKDNFNRRAVDMLDYTADQTIFELIMDKTYPDLMRALESAEYEIGLSSAIIKPFKPK